MEYSRGVRLPVVGQGQVEGGQEAGRTGANHGEIVLREERVFHEVPELKCTKGAG